ncbi:glycosyl hydrolase family 18 protein [Fulvitalea axinellae]
MKKLLPILLIAFALFTSEKAYAQIKALDKVEKKLYKGVKQISKRKKKNKKLEKTFDKLTGKKGSAKAVTSSDSTQNGVDIIVDHPAPVGQYKDVYTFVNGKKSIRFNNINPETDSVFWNEQTNTYYKIRKDIRVKRPGFKSVIWYPYWQGENFNNINLNLITDILFYSYNIDPYTGLPNEPQAISDWKKTALVDTANTFGIRSLLTATSYSQEGNTAFLLNPYAQETFIDSVVHTVMSKNGAGINIDFHPIPDKHYDAFTGFVLKLAAEMDKAGDLQLYLTVPANGDENFDVSDLNKYVDCFLIVNHPEDDYSYSNNQHISPPFPLHSGKGNVHSMNSALNFYANKGISPNKTIFNVYDYAMVWEMKNRKNFRGSFVEYSPFENMELNFPNRKREAVYDPEYASNYLLSGDKVYWFEDERSLKEKIDWAIDYNTGGLAFWSIVDKRVHEPFWRAISQNIAQDSVVAISPISSKPKFTYTMAHRIVKYEPVITIALMIVFFALIIGAALSLLDWRVQEQFFQKKLYRYVYIFIVLASVTTFFLLNDGIDNGMVALVIGIFLGGVAFFLIHGLTSSHRGKLP